ncbi:UDP-N-acetylglucosamine:LPS N-acetylglucosamine transferase [Kytococcus aerolatus]|uniref:UDP-N-acetylglucosamine:LPS N-acetylglucosamine transferase n=1 Tax=Kytococcus aerolatus TaxID=592308 RepID=A0A212THB1_9MICO|nr:UDP-N-acetylglucosamine--LPS N-acetylglucosamine transferase [Kytococcus aerolatus]SNC65365.1 UDP-N-acetylglucosamine:LPS N-acetylglucosamine transferase [Kytococcus aerolatus]
MTPRAPGPRVLMMSSNGTGMGHLARLLAYARHLPGALPGVRTSFLSLSTAAPLVRRLGYDVEYLPSTGSTGLRPAAWRPFLVQRLSDVLDRVRPDVVVFDGTHPYRGIDEVIDAHPQTRWVWSRRGMWRPGLATDQVRRSAWFDRVVEPGDLAAAADVGATSRDSGRHLVRVGPVTMVDRTDLLDRATARARLGLPTEGRLALVSLGAGNINDTTGLVGATASALRERGIVPCVTHAAISRRPVSTPGVHVVQDFPVAHCLAAFDLGVVAGGYNSFHESLRLGLPSAFAPNPATALDDQARRTGFAAARGWAVDLPEVSPPRVLAAVDRLLAEGGGMARAAIAADPGNGAPAAAAAIADLIREVRGG